MWSAQKGFNTLIVSSDPAHSTQDTWDQEIGHDPTPIHGVPNLWGVEIDPERVLERMPGLMNLSKMLDDGGEDDEELTEADFQFPGLDEILAFDLMLEYVESFEYDLVVFDTAPTGHTLNLLAMPEMMDTWIVRLLRLKNKLRRLMKLMKKDDDAFAGMENFKKRVEHIRRVLSDERLSSFYFVAIPEEMAVQESKRAKRELGRFGIPVKGVVINNVLHPGKEAEDIDCDLCGPQKVIQQKYLDALQREFQGLDVAQVPRYPIEIRKREAIQMVSNHIMGGEQLNIKLTKSLVTEHKNGKFFVRIYFPGAQKSDVKMRGKGNRLHLNLNGIASEIEAPFPVKNSHTDANFENEYLQITVKTP
jgi:arsenite-transporting ATPase